MEVGVRTKDGVLNVNAGVLDVARLVASAHGFHLDIEPMAPGAAKLTATHGTTGAIVRANGSSVEAAAEKLIGLLTHE